MRHFPIFLDLQGRAVLVLGEGEVADRKAEAVLRCGAVPRRIARFDANALDGCVLAIGADAPEHELLALSAAAQQRGVPVNIVDRPELCSYITPSVIDRDPIVIAVSSGGEAPVLARLLRARIEALVPPAYGRLAALVGRFKEALRRRLPDVVRRRRVLEAALQGTVADLVFAGRDDAAADLFADMIARPERGEAGIVFLVGAGPGAADLLTLRAQRLLGEADVIVHDRLVSDEVLDMARRDAERIYVGKARANHCMRQEDINALLVRLAQEGRRVVRLKGGDPFVFGRGGEEAAALAAAGQRCEVVPGITAALACAAGAGIPLTHREAARTLTFITGHTKDGRLDVDFAAVVAAGGTLAVYMGVVSLPELVAGLLAHGMPGATALALVENGGTLRQRNWFGSVDSVVAAARGWHVAGWQVDGPTLVLIGAAVGYASSMPQTATDRGGDADSGRYLTI